MQPRQLPLPWHCAPGKEKGNNLNGGFGFVEDEAKLAKRKFDKNQPPKSNTGNSSRISRRRRTLYGLVSIKAGQRFKAVIGPAKNLLPAASATAAAALARLVAIPAEDRAVATRFKWHCCRLAATRTNHRCSLCRSRTVAGAPLIVLLCLTASLATLWGRITTFLKERLISSGEGKVLPAIAARKLHISGHGSPRGDCTALMSFAYKDSFESEKTCARTGFAARAFTLGRVQPESVINLIQQSPRRL